MCMRHIATSAIVDDGIRHQVMLLMLLPDRAAAGLGKHFTSLA